MVDSRVYESEQALLQAYGTRELWEDNSGCLGLQAKSGLWDWYAYDISRLAYVMVRTTTKRGRSWPVDTSGYK